MMTEEIRKDSELKWLQCSVESELIRARKAHPKRLNSPHEAYAIIKEELEEFWDIVKLKSNDPSYDKTFMRDELIQIAAMAIRTILDLKL
jgi:hypothetical protein